MAEDCRRCRDWKGCPGKGWYSYSEVTWCPQQVFFLLKFADYLHAGQWPAPDDTAPPGVRGRISTEAAFTKATLIIGELDLRLDKTGWRGKLLAEECKNREKVDYLSDEARDALYYVVGWKRKDRSFSVWLRDRRHRKKATKASHFGT